MGTRGDLLVWALWVGAMGGLGSCAVTSESVHSSDEVHLTRAEYDRLVASANRAAALENEIVGLRADVQRVKARVEVAEMRTGLAPAVSDRLKRGRSGERIRLLESATRVETYGGKERKVKLRGHLAGFDGYVVSFWATWCVPCCAPEELSLVRKLRRQLRRHNVELLSVAIDDLAAVLGDRRADQWIYPLWQERGAHLSMLPRSLVQRSGVSLPLFLLVGRDGTILSYVNHRLDAETVRDMVTIMANGS